MKPIKGTFLESYYTQTINEAADLNRRLYTILGDICDKPYRVPAMASIPQSNDLAGTARFFQQVANSGAVSHSRKEADIQSIKEALKEKRTLIQDLRIGLINELCGE